MLLFLLSTKQNKRSNVAEKSYFLIYAEKKLRLGKKKKLEKKEKKITMMEKTLGNGDLFFFLSVHTQHGKTFFVKQANAGSEKDKQRSLD